MMLALQALIFLLRKNVIVVLEAGISGRHYDSVVWHRDNLFASHPFDNTHRSITARVSGHASLDPVHLSLDPVRELHAIVSGILILDYPCHAYPELHGF